MSRAGSLPLLRTWKSGRFRLSVALVLVILGVPANGVFARVMHEAQPRSWAYDMTVYYHASERIGPTRSPYLATELAGPVDALCPDCYLYPPPLAQAFALLTAVSLDAARIIWLALQAIVMFAAVWLAAGIGGARRSLERAVWCLAAVVWYVPVFVSMWYGNVSTLLALCVTLVAMGGMAAGIGAAAGSLLKVSPATLIPAALVMDDRARRSFVISTALIVGISLAVTPEAWVQYPTVLANMIRGSTDYTGNLAPAVVAAEMGFATWVAALVRVATIVIGLCCVVGSVLAARRADGVRFAALLATIAMLLIPGTFWYHYLAVLLPFAAMAWPGSAFGGRVGLLASAALVSIGPGAPVIALLGALLLVVVAGHALRPSVGVDVWASLRRAQPMSLS